MKTSYERQVQQYKNELTRLQQPVVSSSVSERERNELITKLRSDNAAVISELDRQLREADEREQSLKVRLVESSHELERLRSEVASRNSTIDQLQVCISSPQRLRLIGRIERSESYF